MAEQSESVSIRRVRWPDVGREPFRVFFPLGVLAAVIGALLWPLHLWGLSPIYPGQAHARLMAFGLFGAFILGFLGTSLPRLLSAPPLGVRNVLGLAFAHLVTIGLLALGHPGWADHVFLAELLWFIALAATRALQREDLPPPEFVLAGLAFLCVVTGTVIGVIYHYNDELDPHWVLLRRLLCYQGFVLLPILGVGPSFMPRLFGVRPAGYPEMRHPNAAWTRRMLAALVTGIVVLCSFLLEAGGWYRIANALRFAAVLGYVLWTLPLLRQRERSAPGTAVLLGFIMMLSGYLAVALFPAYRVALLHLAFAGGFALVAFAVATRVAFGHAGELATLAHRNRWLMISVGIILFATTTRVSGDFWPKIMASHYIYGAWIWIIGVALWAARVLPKLLKIEED